MNNNYSKIIQNNLTQLYANLPENLAESLPAEQSNDQFTFDAFGEKCRIRPDVIILGEQDETGVLGILISLYALHSRPEPCMLEPLKAFKDFQNSTPYAGAFTTNTEKILVPQVEQIEKSQNHIITQLQGRDASSMVGGDFSFLVRPLPKIILGYVFYKADDEFPASATCLFSNNALSFLPIDALADVGEYTSKKILDLLVTGQEHGKSTKLFI